MGSTSLRKSTLRAAGGGSAGAGSAVRASIGSARMPTRSRRGKMRKEGLRGGAGNPISMPGNAGKMQAQDAPAVFVAEAEAGLIGWGGSGITIQPGGAGTEPKER